ncbi:transketolase [Streptomyces sp. A7024]|uniref:Transketolase n=1 Tax=Streptomyces coryli TaxID=1128680 RepID=A0A6G4U9M4_9ACTN|nr:transketolase [Streptomyces coryli]
MTATTERAQDTSHLDELAAQLRVDAVRAAAAAGSGHPTSSMSGADLMAVLLARHLRYDFDWPEHPGNDRFVLSKGHASPLLYAAFKAAGAITDDELLTFRKHGSRLEGHPTPRLPWVDVATGSLGQGLPIGVGMALAARRYDDHRPARIWVLCGDSEMAEGSVFEALEHAGHERLGNLTAIIDVNRLGQRGPTRHGWDLGAYARRAQACGWHTIEVDGHDVDAIDEAFARATRVTDGPTAVIARTVKGRGVSAVADREGMHGKPVPDADEAIAELGGIRDLSVRVQRPPAAVAQRPPEPRELRLPVYDQGSDVATRNAYGDALEALGAARTNVVALDGEVADSTRAEAFHKAHPDRFYEFYIAEQQLIAAAVGMRALGLRPFAATFAAFLTRAHDFLRMAAISRTAITVCGSHAGVAIGEDGPSQMGLEDLAMMRALPGSTVVYPSDGNATAHLVAALADAPGIGYIRTTRGATPVLYGPDEDFPIGGSKTLRSSADDRLTLAAAGVTVHEALAAADVLEGEGIPVRVLDLYSVKPVDTRTLHRAAADTGHIVTVEDHRSEGGLGDAVAEAFADGRPAPRLTRLAVGDVPGSASPEEQLRDAGIDAAAIADTARRLLG